MLENSVAIHRQRPHNHLILPGQDHPLGAHQQHLVDQSALSSLPVPGLVEPILLVQSDIWDHQGLGQDPHPEQDPDPGENHHHLPHQASLPSSLIYSPHVLSLLRNCLMMTMATNNLFILTTMSLQIVDL